MQNLICFPVLTCPIKINFNISNIDWHVCIQNVNFSTKWLQSLFWVKLQLIKISFSSFKYWWHVYIQNVNFSTKWPQSLFWVKLQHIFSAHVLLDILFHLEEWIPQKKSLISVLGPWIFVRHSWEMFYSKISHSELSHIVRSGLRDGHAISNHQPIHFQLNVLLRYFLTNGSWYDAAPSCYWISLLLFKTLSHSRGTVHICSRPVFRHTMWSTFS